eukprot:991018-Amphidinium_carterae.1
MARFIAGVPDASLDAQLRANPLHFKKPESLKFMDAMIAAALADEGCGFLCMDNAQEAYDKACYDHAEGLLTAEELACILQYTAEDKDPKLAQIMRERCCSPDRSRMLPFTQYMHLLLTALQRLEPYGGREVFCGVNQDLRHELRERQRAEVPIIFWSYTSTTKNETVVRSVLGGARCTLFKMELTQNQARSITEFGDYQDEVLLPPRSCFEVLDISEEG